MSMQNMPVPMTKEQLLEMLDDIRTRINAGDSWEGSLQYEIPIDEHGMEVIGADFLVQAAYRIGNLMGQGGMRLVGEMREVPEGATGAI